MNIASTSTAVTTKTSLDQSLKQAQEMMTMSISVIAYLRELFPDHAFIPDQTTGLELKKLVRGKSPKIDKLLDLIEKGCADALKRQFLKTICFSIYTNKNDPKEVVECYKFNITYSPPMVSVARNDNNLISYRSGVVNDFKKTACALLKELCTLTCSLPCLPRQKYIQLSIMYYELSAPPDYCPPGFKSIRPEEAPMKIFKGPIVNHNFGTTHNDHLKVSMELERRQTDNYEIEDLTLEQSQTLVIGQPSQSTNNDAIVEVNNAIPSTQMPSPPSEARRKSQPLKESDCYNNTCNETLTIETPKLIQPRVYEFSPTNKQVGTKIQNSNISFSESSVRCYCDDHLVSDLDMIQCENCNFWQHTVCAGFFGNNDPRIKNQTYSCYGCLFRDHQHTNVFLFIKDLTNFRRVLSVSFNEQVKNANWVRNRLSLSQNKAKKYFQRLKEEGFIIKVDSKKHLYQPVKSKYVREQVRKYFNPNIHSYPQIKEKLNNNQSKNNSQNRNNQNNKTDIQNQPNKNQKKNNTNVKVNTDPLNNNTLAMASIMSCFSEIYN